MRYRRNSAVLSAEVDDDVVALQADRGFAYGMEQVTASVWRALQQPKSVDELVAILRNEFEVSETECRADLDELLDEMTREGLIEKDAK